MKKASKINTDNEEEVQLVSKEYVEEHFGEATASAVGTDQVVTWAKFILTDDKPNENGQRIPVEEFDNLIRTGVFKPVKMAIGEIKDGHEESRPLGVITNLVRDGNKIMALAALWAHERADDIEKIKEMLHNNNPVNVSWEILYGRSSNSNGVSDLHDTILKAATIVGIPAYAGRTQFIAVAAKKWSEAYVNGLPDSSFLHVEHDGKRYFAYRDAAGKIDTSRFSTILAELSEAPLPTNTIKSVKHQVLKMNAVISADASLKDLVGEDDFIPEDFKLDTKELESKVTDLESKLAEATNLLSAKEKELVDALAVASDANTAVEELQKELEPLRDFKLEADKLVERSGKLSAIKAKFEGASLSKSEEYFEENAEKLLSLDENGLDFMLQEMVAFKEENVGTESVASKQTTSGVPNVTGAGATLSIKDFAAALRENKRK